MRQWVGSYLVQVMTFRLFGAKPLPEPMLDYCQLDSSKQISKKFESEFSIISFKKMHLKMSSAKLAVILSRGKWVKSINGLSSNRRQAITVYDLTNEDPHHRCIYASSGFVKQFKPDGYTMTSSNGNIFRVTGHLCGEFTAHRWIPRTTASDAMLWSFLWSTPE